MKTTRKTMFLEGVEYYPFKVSFKLSNGKRMNWVRYSPAISFAYHEVGQELVETYGDYGVMPSSCTIQPLEYIRVN